MINLNFRLSNLKLWDLTKTNENVPYIKSHEEDKVIRVVFVFQFWVYYQNNNGEVSFILIFWKFMAIFNSTYQKISMQMFVFIQNFELDHNYLVFYCSFASEVIGAGEEYDYHKWNVWWSVLISMNIFSNGQLLWVVLIIDYEVSIAQI